MADGFFFYDLCIACAAGSVSHKRNIYADKHLVWIPDVYFYCIRCALLHWLYLPVLYCFVTGGRGLGDH